MVGPLVERSVYDDRASGASLEVDADGILQIVVEPEFRHGRSVGIVNHQRRIVEAVAEFVEFQAGVVHDFAEGDRLPVCRYDALHAEGHASHRAALFRQFLCEIVDDAVHALVVGVVVTIGACALSGGHGFAVQINGDGRDSCGLDSHADSHAGVCREFVDLRFASTGGLLHLAFDDEPVGLHGAQILRDGWQAEP